MHLMAIFHQPKGGVSQKTFATTCRGSIQVDLAIISLGPDVTPDRGRGREKYAYLIYGQFGQRW